MFKKSHIHTTAQSVYEIT